MSSPFAVSGATVRARDVRPVTPTAARVITAESGVGTNQAAKSTASRRKPPSVGLFGTAISTTDTRTRTATQLSSTAIRVRVAVIWRGANASPVRATALTSDI